MVKADYSLGPKINQKAHPILGQRCKLKTENKLTFVICYIMYKLSNYSMINPLNPKFMMVRKNRLYAPSMW